MIKNLIATLFNHVDFTCTQRGSRKTISRARGGSRFLVKNNIKLPPQSLVRNHPLLEEFNDPIIFIQNWRKNSIFPLLITLFIFFEFDDDN